MMSQTTFALRDFFPFWDQLEPAQREELSEHCQLHHFSKGERIHTEKKQCMGLLLIQSGQLRALILSEAGREITLYRLYTLDICLFSASCMMRNIQFDIQMEIEEDTHAFVVPPLLYDELCRQSALMANYTNELLGSRFSNVMWTLEQILFKSMDSRLARSLLERALGDNTTKLHVTHEWLARDLGSAREVVTRLLKYFRDEGWIALSRGCIELLDEKKLREVADG